MVRIEATSLAREWIISAQIFESKDLLLKTKEFLFFQMNQITEGNITRQGMPIEWLDLLTQLNLSQIDIGTP